MFEKKPVLMDLILGVDGTWAGTKSSPRGEGMVIPLYYPANKPPIFKKEYPIPVPKEAIEGPFDPAPGYDDIPGKPQKVVVLTADGNGEAPLSDKINSRLSGKLEGMRERIEDFKWKNKREKIRRKEAEDEMEKEKNEKKKKSSRRRRPEENPSFLRDRNF